MKNIAILYGHPDPSHERLCYALSKAFQDAAQLTGHAVRRVDLADVDFESVTSSSDYKQGDVDTDIKRVQEMISWADHILIIFPLWMGSMPGKFKMLVEQVFRPGFALDYSEDGFPGKLLEGKSADVVVTMGMPTVAYKGFYFSHGIRNLRRNILQFCGIYPVKVTYFGGVDFAQNDAKQKWFKKMSYLGSYPN
jgi:putative NADPH-quinone reductase